MSYGHPCVHIHPMAFSGLIMHMDIITGESTCLVCDKVNEWVQTTEDDNGNDKKPTHYCQCLNQKVQQIGFQVAY